jgi:K+-transporting ATPase ATPase C chain
MNEYLRPACVMLVLFTVLTGLAYPLAMTGIAQVVAPAAANGSLSVSKGAVVGSKLIGQAFTSDKYFHSRPSAAGDGYNAAASSGSNLGPTSQKLLDRVKASADALGTPLPIPADAVTASGSGLDPHISAQFAETQVNGVAAARSVQEQRVREILSRVSQAPALGVIGEPRVNVLELNLALDAELSGSGG